MDLVQVWGINHINYEIGHLFPISVKLSSDDYRQVLIIC